MNFWYHILERVHKTNEALQKEKDGTCYSCETIDSTLWII